MARRILDNLPDSTVVVDASGVVQWVNPAGAGTMGVAASELIGTSGIDLVHPDDLTAVLLALETVQSKEIGTLLEFRIRTSSGWRLAEVLGAPIPGSEGWIVLTIRDLTERRRWEVASDDETAKLRTLVHHAPSLLVLTDASGMIRSSSGSVTRLLGHDQADLEQQPIEHLVVDADRVRLRAAVELAATRGRSRLDPQRIEAELRDVRHDRGVPYELSIVDLLDDPTVEGLVVTGHDVSERTAAEQNLRQMLSLLHATLDSTADGILVVDLHGRITSYNARFVDMWHLPRSVVESGDDRAAIAHVLDQLQDPEDFLARTKERYADAESTSFDILWFKDGRVFERFSTPQRVAGRVVGRVWSFRDVSRQKHLEAELEHQAFHDSLTGLANQALFGDRVQHALARAQRDGSEVAIVYFDLDDFKRVNDSLGHPVGDQLLLGVAERLRSCVRASDTASRLGGDEFGVLVEGVGAEAEARLVANRIIERFRDPVPLGDRSLVTSVSIGIAVGRAGMARDQLLRNADLAMYAAKRGGKARVEVFAAGMHTAAVDRLETEDDLRAADIAAEFVLAHQPIVELDSGRLTGVESLVRWLHPRRGILGPDRFIGAAEDIGVIADIGSHVLHAAVAQAVAWSERGHDLTVSVNVSPRQLSTGTLVPQVREVLATSGIDPNRLVLELTETAMLQDTSTVAANLRSLRSLGVRLALDDFGTGFSSLTHLQRFPIDIIKIDRSFIEHALHDPALVRAVIRLTEELGIVAIAEGVETATQVALLQDAGCRLGQGYFFARPGPASAIDRTLQRPGRRIDAAGTITG